MLEYADFVRSSAGAGLSTETVRRVRGACNWLEGLLPHLLPAVDQLLGLLLLLPLELLLAPLLELVQLLIFLVLSF